MNGQLNAVDQSINYSFTNKLIDQYGHLLHDK